MFPDLLGCVLFYCYLHQNKIMELVPLHKILFEKTKKFIIEDSKDKDTTSDEYLNNFTYDCWDRSENKDLETLKPVTSLLLSSKCKDITETNLAIANANSDWKEYPPEEAIAEYLNDFLNYLIPRIINLDDWEIGFKKNYEIFEKEFLSEELSANFFGHLVNFSYDFSGSGELNNHTRIICLHSSNKDVKYEVLCNERADYFKVKNALDSCFPPVKKQGMEKQFYYLLYYTKKIKKENFLKELPVYKEYLMQNFILGLRLLSYFGEPYSNFLVVFYQGKISSQGFKE